MKLEKGGRKIGNHLLFLIGFGLAVAGGVSVIMYMNFLPAGISWTEYFNFVRTRIECYFLPIGLAMVFLAIHRTDTNHEPKA